MRRAALLALLALAACGPDPVADDRPLVVSVIGGTPRLADADRHPLDPPSAALLTATAQGLVRFDGNGQIEPGLAIRWDVSDDGLYYTFRLRDDAGIDAGQAARRLRTVVARASANPLKPILTAVAEIVAVTPEVIELRMAAPRPDLLQLFAQPELALVVGGKGSGPLHLVGRRGSALRLAPLPDPDAPADAPHAGPGAEILLHGERAAMAVARFEAKQAAVVTGGTFVDLAIARAAQPQESDLRFDPATGILGLQFVSRQGALGTVEVRRALAAAIDRDRIAAAFAVPGWRAATTLLPSGTEVTNPATPDWQALPAALRARSAAAAIAAARPPGTPPLRLRVAMPAGPGARLMFALLAIDWREIGVAAEAVAADSPADLRLIDEVAPGDVATWYLRRLMCVRAVVCSEAADQLLEAARTTPSIADRATRIAEADARLTAIASFIPIASPLRWSLVARDLKGWQDNPRAAHPLYHLRDRD